MDLSDQPKPGSAPGPAGATVGHLVDVLGPATVRLLTPATGRERPVRATLLQDPAEPLPPGRHTLLLAVGVEPRAAVDDFVAEVAAQGYCGVVVKARGQHVEPLATAATRAGVAVLVAADELSWRHLDDLAVSIIEAAGSDGHRSAPGEDLFALANATAAAIGGSVAIEDLERRVLAYSSLPEQRIDELRRQSILDRRVPLLDRHLAQYGAVLAAPGVVRFGPDEVETPRAAVTVRAGDQPLGTIWAIEGEQGLDPLGERALLDAGRLAALPMLRRKHAAELGSQARERALRSALDGDLDLRDLAFRLALTPGSPLTLLGFSLDVDGLDGGALLAQLSMSLARHMSMVRPDVTVAVSARAAYALVPGDTADAAARLARNALGSLGAGLAPHTAVAVSTGSTRPQDLPGLRREVDDVLRVLLARPSLPRPATLDLVRTQVVLAHVADTFGSLPRLRHPAVEELIRHDEEHRTEFTASVVAWLESGGDVASAAQTLGIHTNTLRYRLRRVEERFGVRLGDPDARLVIWLHLRTRS